MSEGWWDWNGIYHTGDFDEVLLPGDVEAATAPTAPQEPAESPSPEPEPALEVPRAPQTPQVPDRSSVIWATCERCGGQAHPSSLTALGRMLCEACSAHVFRFGEQPISRQRAMALLARQARDRLRRSGR